jgi:hypothetical protein
MADRASKRTQSKKRASPSRGRKRVHEAVDSPQSTKVNRSERWEKRTKKADDAEAANPRLRSTTNSKPIGKNELKSLGLSTMTTMHNRSQPVINEYEAAGHGEEAQSPEVSEKARLVGIAPNSAAQASRQQSPETRTSASASPTSCSPLAASEGGAAPTSSTELELHDCDICGDSSPASDFPAREGCENKTNVCRSCFTDFLTHKVDSAFEMQGNTCPCSIAGCRAVTTWESAKQYATPELNSR